MSSHEVPVDLAYTREHEWVRLTDGVATVGITAYAADALGDVVYAQLPELGREVAPGDVTGEVESHKSVSEIFSPLAGEVVAVNDELATAPELVSSDPYDEGWLFRLEVPEEATDLLDAAEYEAYLDTLEA